MHKVGNKIECFYSSLVHVAIAIFSFVSKAVWCM